MKSPLLLYANFYKYLYFYGYSLARGGYIFGYILGKKFKK